MISKEQFKKVVETVVSKTGKTQEDLAKEMKYGYNYISEMFTPTGKVSEKFANAFIKHYGEYLENPKKPDILDSSDIHPPHTIEILLLTLQDISQSNKELAQSQKILADTNQELVMMLKVNSSQSDSASEPGHDLNKGKAKDPIKLLSGRKAPHSEAVKINKQKGND